MPRGSTRAPGSGACSAPADDPRPRPAERVPAPVLLAQVRSRWVSGGVRCFSGKARADRQLDDAHTTVSRTQDQQASAIIRFGASGLRAGELCNFPGINVERLVNVGKLIGAS